MAQVISGKQKQWLTDYKATTMLEPMYLDELRSGAMTFDQVATRNINWYEAHFRDAYNAISNNVPWSENG